MAEQLKPCPRCDATNERSIVSGAGYSVHCGECGFQTAEYDHLLEAVAVWNACTVEAALLEALEPFAKASEIRLCGGDYWTPDKTIQGTDIAFHITFGDLKRAYAAIRLARGEASNA